MAEALAVGLINGGAVEAKSVFVYDRNPPKIEYFESFGMTRCSGPLEVAEKS